MIHPTESQSPQPVAEAKRLAEVVMDELLALRIRSLIADKEMVTATANMDIARSGEWRCDYTAWHGHIDQQIEALFLLANAEVRQGAKDADLD